MAPASAKRTETKPPVQDGFPKVNVSSQLNPFLEKIAGSSSCSSVPHVTSWGNNTFNTGPTEAPISPLLLYEILQFPLEDADEFFGGLCGGLKDFERLRLLALLPPLLLPPEAALLATE